MHEKAGKKAVVNAFRRGDAAEGFQMPVQHGLGNSAVVRVIHGGNSCPDILQSLVPVDGGHGHQTGGVAVVLRQGHANMGQAQLRTSLEFRYIPPDFDNSANVLLGTHRAAVVPYLHIDGAGFISDHGAEKGFSVGGYLLVGLLQ